MRIDGYREGFSGEKVFRLNQDQTEQSKNNSLSCDLYVTDIGYFPNAVNHLVERTDASAETILIYCIHGNGWFTLRDRVIEVFKGQFFLIPAGESHRYGSDTGWQIYWVHFGGLKAENVVSRIGGCFDGALPGPDSEDAVQLFEKMIGRAEGGLTMNTVDYLHFTLWHLLGLFIIRAERSIFRSGGKMRISASIEFMKERLSSRLALTEMAEHAGYSVSHFTQLFRADTGYAPIDFYLQLKIQHAAKLLTTTQLRVGDIAERCGYDNPYYFSRLFRKITGYSPRQYRQQYRV